ncbi:MAG: GNAT family N-acetyltransferase [Fimbriimonadaceae bacterium]|nr:GNAT family N-acetyltransferase [Chthonomonadaceae bacterium]MCO5296756.1 GNAT family N-acetyltransferase [Fimbriimonadaceae bacterium]
MIEIRPIVSDEARPFLELLCEVFELDASRAEGIFFGEPFFDLDRKWALFEAGVPISILTTVPLQFGWGRAFGIAGVATRPDRRGKGYAGQLLDAVFARSEREGEGAALLFARLPELYERAGFRTVDEVVRLPVPLGTEAVDPDVLTFEEVEARYSAWAERDPARLRRDARRWRYWRWTLRMCTALADGYLCLEGNTLREAVFENPPDVWPFSGGVEWFGLRSMAEGLGIEGEGKHELFLMARNVPVRPQMFLTDQF